MSDRRSTFDGQSDAVREALIMNFGSGKPSRQPSRLGSRRSSRRSSMMNIAEDSQAQQTCNRVSRATLVLFCLILTIIALVLIGIGIFAPSWFTLDVSEYGQEWQFGLWMYCRRGGSRNEVGVGGYNLREWICDLRQTIPNPELYRMQASFVDTDHNEIPVLICLSMAFLFTAVSMFALCCAYCNKYVPYCILITNLLAMGTSLIGVLLYVVSMQDVEARRFTSYNSVYFARFGYAAYCAIAGAIFLVLNFVVSIPMTILTFAWSKYKDGDSYQGGGGGAGAYRDPRMDAFDQMDDNQGVFVVERDPDSKSIVSVKRYNDESEMQDAMSGAYGRGGGSMAGSLRRPNQMGNLDAPPVAQYGNAKQQAAAMDYNPASAYTPSLAGGYGGNGGGGLVGDMLGRQDTMRSQTTVHGNTTRYMEETRQAELASRTPYGTTPVSQGPMMAGYLDVNQPVRQSRV